MQSESWHEWRHIEKKKNKIDQPPQYTTCFAWDSAGADSATSAIFDRSFVFEVSMVVVVVVWINATSHIRGIGTRGCCSR